MKSLNIYLSSKSNSSSPSPW